MQPMHVGALQVFKLPVGAEVAWLTDLYDEVIASNDIDRLFRQRPYWFAWARDTDVDLGHHIRHSALPRPGRIRELLADPTTRRTGAAPRTILNVPITGARRYAAQGWPLARLRGDGLARSSGGPWQASAFYFLVPADAKLG